MAVAHYGRSPGTSWPRAVDTKRRMRRETQTGLAERAGEWRADSSTSEVKTNSSPGQLQRR
jgi:hypothetical protein